MNFREFYVLHEDRNYILMKDRNGQYQVIGPKSSQDLPRAMQAAQHANHPSGIWSYNISAGQLHLPPELEHDKENILHAHYSRMGFNRMATHEPDIDDESEYIDPKYFNPQYGWRKYAATQQGTPSDSSTI